MMKLGTNTGSLVNHMYSRMVLNEPMPEVGTAATLLSWSDRHPATVIEVKDIRGTIYITVQEDDHTRIDNNGMSESQEYTYTPNPNGPTSSFRKNKKGFWESVVLNAETGRWNKRGCGGIKLGSREYYYDYSF